MKCLTSMLHRLQCGLENVELIHDRSLAEVRSNLRQVVALESWTSGLRFANETKAYPSTRTEVESQILHLRKGLAAQLVNDTLFLCHLVADDGHLSAKAWQPRCFMLDGTTARCWHLDSLLFIAVCQHLAQIVDFFQEHVILRPSENSGNQSGINTSQISLLHRQP